MDSNKVECFELGDFAIVEEEAFSEAFISHSDAVAARLTKDSSSANDCPKEVVDALASYRDS